MNTRDLIFQDIRLWHVINVVTLIHGYLHLISHGIVVDVTLVQGYSHFISLEIVISYWKLGYWKLRSFQQTQVNLNGLLEKPDITYPTRNSVNGIS